ncbi:TPA: hypothetical protein HA371_07580 [Candidatus Woesearchaeota archaeon]|nr:hypothetical protein [Candidatus Woesearchaeota archaeon]HIJ14574.1 hypothetical protein [Candidatus Woesearchaeota archaeon]
MINLQYNACISIKKMLVKYDGFEAIIKSTKRFSYIPRDESESDIELRLKGNPNIKASVQEIKKTLTIDALYGESRNLNNSEHIISELFIMNDLETVIEIIEHNLNPVDQYEYTEPHRETSIYIGSESETSKNKYYDDFLNRIHSIVIK